MIVQAVSIYLRVEQYGFTEQRYLIVLSTLWLGVLAVAYSVRKPPLKMISGLLAVLFLVSALGPLSAANVAERSQMKRLETLPCI